MFIELTDHLRCPATHPESFLVLLPDRMAGRRVVAGTLGCPTCGRVVAVTEEGVAFGGDPPPPRQSALSAAAIAALLSLEGPGGYLAVLGGAGAVAPELASLLPGVRLVLINPPAGMVVAEVDGASVLRAGRSPLKSRSMRGVVVSGDHGADAEWAAAAAEALLPGNRLVVEGPRSPHPEVEVLAEADGVWVGRTATTGIR